MKLPQLPDQLAINNNFTISATDGQLQINTYTHMGDQKCKLSISDDEICTVHI